MFVSTTAHTVSLAPEVRLLWDFQLQQKKCTRACQSANELAAINSLRQYFQLSVSCSTKVYNLTVEARNKTYFSYELFEWPLFWIIFSKGTMLCFTSFACSIINLLSNQAG